MDLKKIIDLVSFISSLKPGSISDKQIDQILIQNHLMSQDGTPSRAKLLGEIERIGVEKVFAKISLDDRKNFLANISSARHAFPEISKIVQTVETTVSADVGAFPVPLGQLSPGRKKEESISKRMGFGAYELSEVTDADEDINEALKLTHNLQKMD